MSDWMVPVSSPINKLEVTDTQPVVVLVPVVETLPWVQTKFLAMGFRDERV